MSSKLLTLSADGATATPTDAVAGDIFTTLWASDKCVTGAYKYIQSGLVFTAGMVFQNVRLGLGYNPFVSRG
jgi:hypothetical protein